MMAHDGGQDDEHRHKGGYAMRECGHVARTDCERDTNLVHWHTCGLPHSSWKQLDINTVIIILPPTLSKPVPSQIPSRKPIWDLDFLPPFRLRAFSLQQTLKFFQHQRNYHFRA